MVCRLLEYIPGHCIVGEEEPEAKDRLRHDIEDSVGDDFGINIGDAGSVSDTPDAGFGQSSEFR